MGLSDTDGVRSISHSPYDGEEGFSGSNLRECGGLKESGP